MLWFYFILSSNFIFLCFKLIIIYYNTQRQKKGKFEPRIKLNHNTYITYLPITKRRYSTIILFGRVLECTFVRKRLLKVTYVISNFLSSYNVLINSYLSVWCLLSILLYSLLLQSQVLAYLPLHSLLFQWYLLQSFV